MTERPKFYTAIENIKIIDVVEINNEKKSIEITAQNPTKEQLVFTVSENDGEKFKVGEIGTLVISISNKVTIEGIPGTGMGEIAKEEIVLQVEDFVVNDDKILE